jgi:hypothetical protein
MECDEREVWMGRITPALFGFAVVCSVAQLLLSCSSESRSRRGDLARRPHFEIDKLLSDAQVASDNMGQAGMKDVILRELARVRARSGNVDGALRAATGIVDKQHKLSGYVNVIKGLHAAGMTKEARAHIAHWLESAREGKGEFADSGFVGSLAVVAAECGFLDWSLSILKEAGIGRVTPYDIHRVAIVAAQHGELGTALQLMGLNASDAYEPRHRLLSEAAMELLKQGNLEGVLDIVQVIEVPELRRSCVLGLVRALIAAGEVKKAKGIAEQDRSPSIQAGILGEVALAELARGNKVEASAIYATLGSKLDANMNRLDRIRTLCVRFELLSSLEGTKEAMADALEIEGEFDQLEDEEQSWSLRIDTLECYARAGCADFGLTRLPDAKALWRQESIRAIIRGLAARGEMNRALTLLEALESSRDRAWAFFDIAHLPQISANISKKRDLLRRCFDVIPAGELSETRTSGYDTSDTGTLILRLHEAQAHIGDYEGCWRTVHAILERMGTFMGGVIVLDTARQQAMTEPLEKVLLRLMEVKPTFARAMLLVGAAEGALTER